MRAVDAIFEFARRTPSAPAFVFNLEPISYARFAAMIGAKRRSLEARGLPIAGVSLICIDNLLVAWIVELALRSLGLTTVAIRSAAQLEDLRGLDITSVVTASAGGLPELSFHQGVSPVRIGVDESDWTSGEDQAALEVLVSPSTGGHVLLTSGTTGRSKLVLMDAAYEADNLKTGPETFVCADGALRIDERPPLVCLGDMGLWTHAAYSISSRTWSRGGGVIVHAGADPHRALATPNITHVLGTPFMFARYLAAPAADLKRNDDLQVVIGGGPLSAALADELRARLSRRLATIVASTEVGMWALTPIGAAADLHWHALVAGAAVDVVDEADRVLPPRELGQVRVRTSTGVAGYLGDADASAAAFRGGFFYPGDLGVKDARGRLALQGRVTDVLNVRGDKVAAAPFEATLQAALGVESVCVLSEQGADGGEELHVALETTEPIDEARLREAARTHLSGFPAAHFHFVPQLPRNHMGKVQRLLLKRRLVEQHRIGAAGSGGAEPA